MIKCSKCGLLYATRSDETRDEVTVVSREMVGPDLECPECLVNRLRRWVADLQSGMFINCVYCGHRYGPRPDTPVAMADVLKAHIETCPDHPLSRARSEIARLRAKVTELREEVKYWQLKGMRR